MQRRYVAHFAERFTGLHRAGYRLHFVTLTLDPKTGEGRLSRREEGKRLQHAWEKFRKRLNRRYKNLRFVAVEEPHRDGRPHLHVVMALRGPVCPDATDAGTMQIQWFESGGGAVMDVKPLRDGLDGEPTPEGTPDTIAGALGYALKYAFKRAAVASSRGEKVRAVRCSEGDGYHAAEHREARQRYAAGAETVAEVEGDTGAEAGESAGGTVTEWEPTVKGFRSRPYTDALTPEDRERFDALDLSARTHTYREKRQNDPEHGGRTTWRVYELDRREERLTVTTFDRWPDAAGAEVLTRTVEGDPRSKEAKEETRAVWPAGTEPGDQGGLFPDEGPETKHRDDG